MIRPNAAIIGPNAVRSPADIEEAIDRLGNLVEGPRVGIAISDPALFVAAAIATWRVGGVVVLLSSRAPSIGSVEGRQLNERIRNASCHSVVADAAHAEIFRALGATGAVSMRVWGSTTTVWRTGPAVDEPMPEDVALIAYTSGSTGRPKGVMLSRSTVEHVLRVNAALYDWRAGDRFLAALPCSHLAGFFNLLSALEGGADVVESPSFAWPMTVLDTCRRLGVTVLGAVPYFLARLLDTSRFAELRSVRLIVTSSAPLASAHRTKMQRARPDLVVVDAYGLTEAFRSTLVRYDGLTSHGTRVDVPGVEVEVRCDVVHIRGPNVMLGYWRRPDATAAVLVDGCIRTNDLGWVGADGRIHLSGRRDNVINGGGEKIAYEVLEDVLADALGTDDLAVAAVSLDVGRDEVVLLTPRSLSVEDVRRAIARRAHAAFWPTRIVPVRTLPRRETGKLDRRALAAIVANEEMRRCS